MPRLYEYEVWLYRGEDETNVSHPMKKVVLISTALGKKNVLGIRPIKCRGVVQIGPIDGSPPLPDVLYGEMK